MAATERIARSHSGQADEVNSRLQDATGRYSTQLLETVQWMMEPIAERRPGNADQVLRELLDAQTAIATGKQTSLSSKSPQLEKFEASPALTSALQNTLEKHAGRIARKVVPRAVSAAASYDDLVNHLAGYVLNPESEIEFRSVATGLPARASEAATQAHTDSHPDSTGIPGVDEEAAAAATSLHDDLLDKAHTHLANYVGPIASVLIEAAAAQTTDAARFIELLADEIDDPADRREFLAALR